LTKARNRLGKERAEKLIYVRQNSRVLQKGRDGAHDDDGHDEADRGAG
jgi:hypothetical protein